MPISISWIFSDDFNFCRTFIRHLPNVFFASKANAIEQLCLMSPVRPFYHQHHRSAGGARGWEKGGQQAGEIPFQLAGEMLRTFDNKDYYPARWSVYDHSQPGPDTSALRTRPMLWPPAFTDEGIPCIQKTPALMADTVKYVHDPRDHNLDAPREIVPLLANVFQPRSVVDYGCGLGNFLMFSRNAA